MPSRISRSSWCLNFLCSCGSFINFLLSRATENPMALKAVHASDVPCLGDVPEIASETLCEPGLALSEVCRISPEFLVIGHRGSGMNKLGDEQTQAFRENTLKAFHEAIRNGGKFIEFDVQVTKDGKAVLFHDDSIITGQNGRIREARIEDLTLEEFLSYGLQEDGKRHGKPLLRRDKNGKAKDWRVTIDDPLCTLQDALEKVDTSIGFNIEVKFDDEIQYTEDRLKHALHIILEEVRAHAKGRRIFFSSFHPDAAQILRKSQDFSPVFFLTKGGTQIFSDSRRNSIEAAIEVSKNGRLQGIVCEAKAIFKNPRSVSTIKSSGLCLLTYGLLNNSVQAVYIQYQMGVDGVIVDFVREVTEAVAEFTKIKNNRKELYQDAGNRGFSDPNNRRHYFPSKISVQDLSSVCRLILELMQDSI